MNAQHKANRKKLQFAVNRFTSRMTEAAFSQVESALQQVQFDRLEAATDPGPVEAETPELNLEG